MCYLTAKPYNLHVLYVWCSEAPSVMHFSAFILVVCLLGELHARGGKSQCPPPLLYAVLLTHTLTHTPFLYLNFLPFSLIHKHPQETLPNLSDLTRNIRCSCGIGLHFRVGVAQIELNYAIPLKAQPSDL